MLQKFVLALLMFCLLFSMSPHLTLRKQIIPDPATVTGYTVATNGHSSISVPFPFQRNSFWSSVGSRWTEFYIDSSGYLDNASCTDGTSWKVFTNWAGLGAIFDRGYEFSIYYWNGTYVYIVVTGKSSSYATRIMQSTIDSNGYPINSTWYTVEEGGFDSYAVPSIMLDSFGIPYVAFDRYYSGAHHVNVTKATGSDGSGPYTSWIISTGGYYPCLLQLNAYRIYCLYYTGSNTLKGRYYDPIHPYWQPENTTSTTLYGDHQWSAIFNGTSTRFIKLAYLDTASGNKLEYQTWSIAGGWSSASEIQSAVGAGGEPTISTSGDGRTYLYWINASTTIWLDNHTGSSWQAAQSWVTGETTSPSVIDSSFSAFGQRHIGTSWNYPGSGKIRFCNTTVSTPSLVYGNIWQSPTSLGGSCTFTSLWTAYGVTLSKYMMAHNVTSGSSPVNGTWTAFPVGQTSAWANVTLTLPTLVRKIGWIMYANVSTGTQVGTSINIFTCGLATIDSSTVQTATAYNPQYKSFRTSRVYWAFYSNGTHLCSKTSIDGCTWANFSFMATKSGMYILTGNYFSIRNFPQYPSYSSYVYLIEDNETVNSPTTCPCNFTRGTLVNGGFSITWGTTYRIFAPTGSNLFQLPNVAIDSNGVPWVCFTYGTSSTGYLYVYKASASDGSGTWTQKFKSTASVGSTDSFYSTIEPLSGGKMIWLYTSVSNIKLYYGYYDGSSVSSEEVAVNYQIFKGFSAETYGDHCYIGYTKFGNKLPRFNRWMPDSWGTEQVAVSDKTKASYNSISMCINSATGDCWLIYNGNNTANNLDRMFYAHYTNSTGAWDTAVQWFNASLYSIGDNTICPEPYAVSGSNIIGAEYTGGSSSPYNVMYATFIFSVVASWHTEATWTMSTLARTWQTVATVTFSLEARIWQTTATSTFSLVARAWESVATWTLSLITRSWHSPATWTFILIARSWISTATWTLSLAGRIWSTIASLTFNIEVRIWQIIATLAETLMIRIWQTIATITFNLDVLGWHIITSFIETLTTETKGFLIIAVLFLAALIGAVLILAYRKKEK
jgi:hypothetical protein